MPRKVNRAALTNAPTMPQMPKSTKNNSSSRPDATPPHDHADESASDFQLLLHVNLWIYCCCVIV
jgi:hypothetical protein